MNSGTQFKSTSLILVFLLFTSVFSILLVVAPSAVVADGTDDNVYIIMRGKTTAFNTDAVEPDPPPWEDYETGDCPPIMAAKRVGDGAVVAGGTVATCRNTRWNGQNNAYPYFDDLLDCAFQWMVENAEDVLWYGEYGGPGPSIENSVYNDAQECSELVAALEALGYSVDDTIDSADTPITPDLLDPYDILVIPQLQAGEKFTGGNPDLLPDAWVDAIVSFVAGGGGLLVMEGSDYGGYNYIYVQNKILDALEFPMIFQSDQIADNINNWYANHAPYCEVCSDTEIGNCYETETGDNEIGMYSLCSLAYPGRWVSVLISPLGKTGENGETLTYTVTIINGGDNDDNFSLEAINDGGWDVSIEPSRVSVKGKENENTAILRVTIPDDANRGDNTHTTVTATSETDENVTGSGKTGTERWTEPELENWTVASSLFPYAPSYGITVASAGENIYIADTSSLLRYNTITGVWEGLNSPDVFMNGCCLRWDGGNYIYALVGASYGKVEKPEQRRYDFWRYNISTDDSTRLAYTPWHQGAGNALTFAEIGGKKYLYAFLGTTSKPALPGYTVQFWRYNIADDNWDENLAPPLYGADDGASLAWLGGDYIYAFPGAYNEGLNPNQERHFLRYQISTDNWVEMTQTPYNANGGIDDGGSLAYPGLGDYIYALKGGSDPPGGDVPADNFWRYSVSNDNWEILDHIPAGVGVNNGRRLGVVGGNIYCWRGSYDDGTLWVYTIRDLDVSISPEENIGEPGDTFEYSVTVTNKGIFTENIRLDNTDTSGWTLELSQSLLTNVAPDGSENVTLTVTIPGGASYGVEDLVTVTATAAGLREMSDSASCIAGTISWTGTARFKLENVFRAGLEKDLQLLAGSKLVVKFYKYDNTFQAESVIDNITPPENVKESENVPHPRRAEGCMWGTVQKATLILTTDNTDEVMSTIASFTVTQDNLRGRYIEILVDWFGHPELQDAFRNEIICILILWFSAPS